MAEYGISATQLSDPQGQGTGAVAPVQEEVSRIGLSPVFEAVGNIFINGLKNNAKEEAEKRKKAVIEEYINNENTYSAAMISGQWNATHTAAASRANYSKFIGSYSEYIPELSKARAELYGGGQQGEAERIRQEEFKLREKDKSDASARGHTFTPNESEDSVNAKIAASKAEYRVEAQFDKDRKRAEEIRAQRSDMRATDNHDMVLADRVLKENSRKGALEVADTNFDAVAQEGLDLFAKVTAGSMAPEEALVKHNATISRIKATLLSVTSTNPELAAPWNSLFGEMSDNIKLQLDPAKKSTSELQLLKNQYDTLIVKQKLLAVGSDKDLQKAVVAASLFPNDVMVDLVGRAPIAKWLYGSTGVDPSLPKSAQMVGTPDDAKVFQAAKKAINYLQSGNVPKEKQASAEREAVNMINSLLKDTTTVSGELNAAALKQASTFFASPEFGKMAMEGKVDRVTASNAQHVFQIQYVPAIQQSINSKLETEIVPGEPLSRSVNIKMVGNNVVFDPNIVKRNPNDITQAVGRGLGTQGMNANAFREGGAAELKDAAAGLNQLIRLHAHLEGTTDYPKYWEANKHYLMPNIFPDPEKLKPGQTIKAKNGKSYKYLGGNYNDIPGSYMEVPSGQSGE